MIHLIKVILFVAVLTSLQRCKEKLTPIDDLSLFTSHAVIEPDFEFNGNLSVFATSEFDSTGTTIALSRVEGNIAFDEQYNQFRNQYKEHLYIRIPELSLGCYDLKSIISEFSANNRVSASYSRTNFDEFGENYILSLDDDHYSELCITYISNDQRVIEGTNELVLIFNPIPTRGQKHFAPWLPDTLKFRDGTFAARVGVD